MPKFNMYQSLHTTVIGPEGRPLEIQIRTREMHAMAEFGVAAHWMYKQHAAAGGWAPRRRAPHRARRRALATKRAGRSGVARSTGSGGSRRGARLGDPMLDWQQELSDPKEFMERLRVGLFEDEVYVFTPKGDVKALAAGATPLDFAYEVHTEIGHRCVGARVNGKIVPLHYELQNGDQVEILTAKRERGPLARLARGREDHARAQEDQAVVHARSRARTPSTPGASSCRSTCASRGCPRSASPAPRCSPT